MSLPRQLLSSKYIDYGDLSVREDLDINDYINNQEFEKILKKQYMAYHNIGWNVLNLQSIDDVGFDLDIIRDFLYYVDQNMVSLPEFEFGTMTTIQIKFLFRVVYWFLFIELPDKLANAELKPVKTGSELKDQLTDYYTKLYDIVKDLDDAQAFKFEYILQMVDTDLDDLVPHIRRVGLDYI